MTYSMRFFLQLGIILMSISSQARWRVHSSAARWISYSENGTIIILKSFIHESIVCKKESHVKGSKGR